MDEEASRREHHRCAPIRRWKKHLVASESSAACRRVPCRHRKEQLCPISRSRAQGGLLEAEVIGGKREGGGGPAACCLRELIHHHLLGLPLPRRRQGRLLAHARDPRIRIRPPTGLLKRPVRTPIQGGMLFHSHWIGINFIAWCSRLMDFIL